MTFAYEKQKQKQGFKYVIGCDEVGRGSLAGPVVAAAVVFDGKNKGLRIKDIKDSKLLTALMRQELSENIKTHALAWSIAEVSSVVIDEINIHHASLRALRLATEKVIKSVSCESDQAFVYVDGKFPLPELSISQQALVEGDNKVLSVAAASIIAKVYRDSLMSRLHQNYPVYNLSQHKGYATQYHRAMVWEHGPSPIHRLTFCNHLTT